jgi:DNA-binding response OmpR family regulator
LLGEQFVVEEGWIESDDDVVIAPVLTEPVIGVIKSRHPGCLILCVLRHVGGSPEVVIALDNGADAAVVRPTMAELAAHVQALVRLSTPSVAGQLTDGLASVHP